MKGEIHVLESKLEAVRARAEEASSGAVGDAQAKLLRQIETLQTQYSVASENWQGIEASLMARSANLEKERDEALRRESDMRKKARETVSHGR
jgi:TATA element modulatory factor